MRRMPRLKTVTYNLLLVLFVLPIQAIAAAEPEFLNKQEQTWLKQHSPALCAGSIFRPCRMV